MNIGQIQEKINEEANVRIGEVIDILLERLRTEHAHQSHRKNCNCEYCHFINYEYVPEKLHLHRLKKLYYYNDDLERFDLTSVLDKKIFSQKGKIIDLKTRKLDYHHNVL